MKKSYTIAGVGACLGKNPGFETLAESLIMGTPIAGKSLPDSLSLAVREALQYTAQTHLTVVTDTLLESDCMHDLALSDQKVSGSFRGMLEMAPENALLLSKRENGWMAIVLTQEEVGFAQLEIAEGAEAGDGDGFGKLLLSALELRFTLHLDDRDSLYRFWDARNARMKELHCDGLKLTLTEPGIPASKVYAAKKYLLPIVFTTIQEAKQKLTALKNADSLKAAMEALLPELAKRNAHTNTIVLLADSFETLEKDVDDLLNQESRLLQKGFTWKRPSGSRYICRSCEKPQIVFMNPPASMFNAKTFYKFFFSVYGAMQQINHFETDKYLTGDKDLFLSDYLFDIVVNYCVMALLDDLGIRPDVMSGASMGELANLLQHIRYEDGRPCDTAEVMSYIEQELKFLARSDDAPLNEYLGRKSDGFTKFYVKGDVKAICAAAKKYEGVFVMIIG